MALTNIFECDQNKFKAREDGSCWGISIEFCKRALETGAVEAMNLMVRDAAAVANDAELHMKMQQTKIHDVAGSKYLKDNFGKISDDISTYLGKLNQGIAIQLRHDVIKELLAKCHIKNIGTLSSFYEGGTRRLIDHLILLSKKAGKASTLFDLQNPNGHTVVLHYDGPALHFFDPNSGLWRADELETAATDLGKR